MRGFESKSENRLRLRKDLGERAVEIDPMEDKKQSGPLCLLNRKIRCQTSHNMFAVGFQSG